MKIPRINLGKQTAPIRDTIDLEPSRLRAMRGGSAGCWRGRGGGSRHHGWRATRRRHASTSSSAAATVRTSVAPFTRSVHALCQSAAPAPLHGPVSRGARSRSSLRA